jgi:hypothetical protein
MLFYRTPVQKMDRLLERERTLAKTISRNLDDTTPRENRGGNLSPMVHNIVWACGWTLAVVVVLLTVALMATNKGS